jgi:hypothetical protein
MRSVGRSVWGSTSASTKMYSGRSQNHPNTYSKLGLHQNMD